MKAKDLKAFLTGLDDEAEVDLDVDGEVRPIEKVRVTNAVRDVEPKRNEPLTWRIEPHGSRPANSTGMGSLFGCDVWYDPDMAEKAYNEWQENHAEPCQSKWSVREFPDGYIVHNNHPTAPIDTLVIKDAADALYDHIKRERGENA